jgi:hypothetical protein
MEPQLKPNANSKNVSKGVALKFVLLLGVVSLFADMTYEGARSVTGPFLASLGASGTVVGIVAGFGELLGYGLRLVSGYLSDRSRKYWTITLFGYVLNLLSVPLLALVGNWEIAALLMMTERTGKAIRNPTRDAMLSHATKRIGRGWGFGLHEAMDQTGALVGPLIFATVLYFKGRGRKPKLNPEQKAQVQQWVKTEPKALNKIKIKIHKAWKVDVSKDTIKRIIKKLNMRWKRMKRGISKTPDEWEIEVKMPRLEKLKEQDKKGEIDLRYLDESGCSLKPYVP